MPDYADILDYLYALKNRGSKYGIERMHSLVEALGHPEQKFPVIHVAGTHGKGSVCAMLADRGGKKRDSQARHVLA